MSPIKQRGDFRNTERFLGQASKLDITSILEGFGKQGVQALEEATPRNTGRTANSWEFEVVKGSRGYKLVFNNTNIVDGVPVVILLQYGHGTRNGSYISGRDFINPALSPIFDRLSEALWKEVTGL